MAALLLCIGIIGLLGSTWLFPLLGAAVARAVSSVRPEKKSRQNILRKTLWNVPRRISVAIPAYNEEYQIRRTLISVNRAIEYACYRDPRLQVDLVVLANGCTDNTVSVARQMFARVIVEPQRTGKWQALRRLVKECSSADWIIFADAGIEWPLNFLRKVIGQADRKNTIAVAPGYSVTSAGAISRLLWGMERQLKSLESSAGGPVTVHGATVCYSRPELERVINYLRNSSAEWLNDDVVLPLLIRAFNPQGRVSYLPDLYVSDRYQDISSGKHYNRRKRMVVGNVQWITQLLPFVFKSSPITGIIALRRVFRVLWAYWIAAITLGLLVIVVPSASLAVSLVLVALLTMLVAHRVNSSARDLIDALRASLAMPIYFIGQSGQGRVAWR